MKSMKIKMTHGDGSVYFWTVASFKGTWLRSFEKSKQLIGWQYTDHEGYKRTVEGNWIELVSAFKLTADNYGFTCNIS